MRKRRWALGIFGLLIVLGGGFLMAVLRPPSYKFLKGGQEEGTVIAPYGPIMGTYTFYSIPRKYEEVRIQVDSELGRVGWKQTDFGSGWTDGTRRISIRGQSERGTSVYVLTPTTWMDRIRIWIKR